VGLSVSAGCRPRYLSAGLLGLRLQSWELVQVARIPHPLLTQTKQVWTLTQWGALPRDSRLHCSFAALGCCPERVPSACRNADDGSLCTWLHGCRAVSHECLAAAWSGVRVLGHRSDGGHLGGTHAFVGIVSHGQGCWSQHMGKLCGCCCQPPTASVCSGMPCGQFHGNP
jgi:hypothetical protein